MRRTEQMHVWGLPPCGFFGVIRLSCSLLQKPQTKYEHRRHERNFSVSHGEHSWNHTVQLPVFIAVV